jgi:osmotically-inducible protein OsmY
MSERRIFHAMRPLFAVGAVALVACASTPTQESMGEYMDDSLITTRVRTALIADSQVHSTEIKIETFKGTVQLSGFARSPDEMGRAADIASRVAGVKEVKNDIRDKAAADLSSK